MDTDNHKEIINEKNCESYNKKKYRHEIIGELAIIISVMAWLPLAWTVTITGDVSKLNTPLLLISLLSVSLWIYFSIVNNIVPYIICNIVIAVILLFLITHKIWS